jgi:hypothetical protein
VGTVVAVVGIAGVIASLLFAGWQAAILAKQTRIQNATASASTLHGVFTWLHDVQGRILAEPKFLAYFRGGETVSLTEDERARMKLITSMYCDVLNIGLHELHVVPSTRSHEGWALYCRQLLRQCSLIADEVAAKPLGYPRLAALLTSAPPTPEEMIRV